MASDLPNFGVFFELFDEAVQQEMEEIGGRFPNIEGDDLEKMRLANQNKNIQKSTSTWLNVFNSWKIARGEERLLEDIPLEELDAVLCKFFAEVRKKDGEEYEPDSLAVMQASLDRHLENLGRPYSVLRDRQFQLSRQQLEAKAR